MNIKCGFKLKNTRSELVIYEFLMKTQISIFMNIKLTCIPISLIFEE